ncbi:MAG: tetratricopeptide repeat protein [Bacteroidota bacterium]
MRKVIFLSVLLIFSNALNAQREDLGQAYKLLRSDLDSAIVLAESILKSSLEENDKYAEIQANYILGYCQKQKKNFGVATIYYLEAIRQAESADYDELEKDKISLRKNLANIFRTFNVNGLATKYNLEAIALAKKNNMLKKQMELMRNQGLVYQEAKRYNEAKQIFLELKEIADQKLKLIALNQLGIIAYQQGDLKEARLMYTELHEYASDYPVMKAKALHNIGQIAFHSGKRLEATSLLKNAIAIFEQSSIVDFYGLHTSYRYLGELMVLVDDHKQAERFLIKAYNLIDHVSENPESFQTYQLLSNLYFQKGDIEKGEYYLNEYSRVSMQYIERQQEIMQRDKEYNFELITKRYFDDVEKKERLKSIYAYAQYSTFGFLLIIALVIGGYQIGKRRLQNSIAQDLRELNVLK